MFVIIEDARLRKWYGSNSKDKSQGAGSIKRSCQIWEEFFESNYTIDYQFVHPIKGGTKLKADAFKKITGYEGSTNEHGRDAAMLIFKYLGK
jgi:hypothetical protein